MFKTALKCVIEDYSSIMVDLMKIVDCKKPFIDFIYNKLVFRVKNDVIFPKTLSNQDKIFFLIDYLISNGDLKDLNWRLNHIIDVFVLMFKDADDWSKIRQLEDLQLTKIYILE